jgi:ubiquinone/menaquinone biosynthesis C-methylase UbiE
MGEYIHGGTDPREVARLEKQARFLGPAILKGFVAKPGERVLDLATGVGAMATELLERFPGIRLVGVDLRASQLATARVRQPGARYAQADASAMPFADGTFDRVHCSWLLEHVSDPLPIVREVRRVLKPGGVAQFIEVDNASFATTPATPAAHEVMAALNRAQIAGGGDPFVGQRLGPLFRAAGFGEVVVTPNEIRDRSSDEARFQGMIDEWAEIFEGLDEALPALQERIHEAVAELRALAKRPDGEIRYCSQIVRATK